MATTAFSVWLSVFPLSPPFRRFAHVATTAAAARPPARTRRLQMPCYPNPAALPSLLQPKLPPPL